MNKEEILDFLYEYYCSRFPKTCSACGHRYETLTEYIQRTRPTGRAVSYDAETGNWGLKRPIGSVLMVNCPCGTTLSLTTDDMPMDRRKRVLKWVHEVTESTGAATSDVLGTLRAEIRDRALSEQDARSKKQ